MQLFFSIILGSFHIVWLLLDSHARLLLAAPQSCFGRAWVSLMSSAFGSYKGDLQRRLTPSVLFSLALWGWQGKELWLCVNCSGFCPSFTNHPLSLKASVFFPVKGAELHVPYGVMPKCQVSGPPLLPPPQQQRFIVMWPNNSHSESMNLCLFLNLVTIF